MNLLNKPVYLVAIGVLVLAVLAGGGYFYYQSTKAQKVTANTEQAAKEEVKKIVAEVGKLIDLPTNEDPTVATVTDVNKLKDQPFFQRAKNGDKVLIYTNAKKAILYDPTAKKVIDVAPLNIGSSSAQVSEPTVALRNGTGTVGLTTKVETELKKFLPQLNITSKENAKDPTYDKTIVVILNDSDKDYGLNLANLLKASVASLPPGETWPKDANILVILGKDKI